MKSQTLHALLRVAVSLTLLVSALLWTGGTASADPILPGFDLLHTPPGGAYLDRLERFGGPPGVVIPLQGRSIGPGNTDTIVERMGGLPDGGLGPIPTEIVALSLQSVAPVPLGASFFDVFVDLNPAVHSLGMITVTSHLPSPPGGGTFDSFFDVFARVTLTDTANPANQMQFVTSEPDRITSTGSLWSHFPPPFYPNDPRYPAGGFYPGTLGGAPGVPGQPVGIGHTGPHPNTMPSSPEPGSILLLMIGVLGFGMAERARR